MNSKWIPWIVVVVLIGAWWWWTQKQKKATAAAAPIRPPNLIVVTGGGATLPDRAPGLPNLVQVPPDTVQTLQTKGYSVVEGSNGVQLVQGGKPYITKTGA